MSFKILEVVFLVTFLVVFYSWGTIVYDERILNDPNKATSNNDAPASSVPPTLESSGANERANIMSVNRVNDEERSIVTSTMLGNSQHLPLLDSMLDDDKKSDRGDDKKSDRGDDNNDNSTDDSDSLSANCTNDHFDLVMYEWEKNNDINKKFEHGQTLAMGAAQNTQTDHMLKYLIDRRVDLNVQNDYGQTALFYAAAAGSWRNVSALIEAGVRVDVSDAAGSQPIDYARDKNYTKCIKLLENATKKT